jgi:hypothetical protein
MPSTNGRHGRPRKNGARYPNCGKLKIANGGANGEPPDATAKWVRQRQLVEAEIIDRRWGSEIGRLNRFGYLTDAEAGAASAGPVCSSGPT